MAKAKTKTASKRKLDLEDAVEGVTEELRALALEAYKQNQAKNAATSAEKKVRGQLLALMKSHKIKERIFNNIEHGDKLINLIAEIERPESEKADIFALAELVEKEVFLQCVSATKQDVVKYAGQAVFEQVKRTVMGEENVKVKPLK